MAATAGDRIPTRGIIDVNVHVGPERGPGRGASLPVLLGELRRHGTEIGLARHLTSTLNDPTSGNRAILELASDPANGLRAVVECAPFQGVIAFEDLQRWRREGAIAFHLGFGAVEWAHDGIASAVRSTAVRATLDAVARAGLPLLVPVTSWSDASAIGEATAGLGIPVVLLGVHYSRKVEEFASAARHDHLHIETSSLGHWRAIEDAVAAVGRERVLFGSGSPTRSGRSPLNAVLHAGVDADARRSILRGNAARLFGLPDGPVDLSPTDLAEGAFDVHTHVMPGPWPTGQHRGDELVPALRPYGTTRAIASSSLALMSDSEAGNRDVVEAAAGAPDHPFGYLVADPWDLDATRDHLRRWGSAPGVVGVKVHCMTYELDTATPQIRDLFDVLAGHGRPVLIHNLGDGWDTALGEIARRHPRLPIIVAHGGLSRPSVEGAQLAASTDNVYLEFASSYAHRLVVAEAAAIAGRDRILFGTDAPLLNPAFILGTYQDAGLDPTTHPDVFGATATRLFGLE